MKNKICRICAGLALLSLMGGGNSLLAEVVTSTTTGGDLLLTTSWDKSRLPTTGDTAVISQSGTGEFNVYVNASTAGAGTLKADAIYLASSGANSSYFYLRVCGTAYLDTAAIYSSLKSNPTTPITPASGTSRTTLWFGNAGGTLPTISSNFTSAKYISVDIIQVKNNGGTNPTVEWLINYADADYNAADWVLVGYRNAMTATISQSAGSLKVGNTLYFTEGGNAQTGELVSSTYNLSGGILSVKGNISLSNDFNANAIINDVNVQANFNFTGGTLKAETNLIVDDFYKNKTSTTNTYTNRGNFNFTFGGGLDSSGRSANLIDTNAKIITFRKDVTVANYASTNGGFTVGGGGTLLAETSFAALTGKVALTGNNTTVRFKFGEQFFSGASEIRIDSGSILDLRPADEDNSKLALITLGANQTISGSGAFKPYGINVTEGILMGVKNSNFLIAGTLAPCSDDGTGPGKLVTQGTVNLCETSRIVLDVFSMDSYDQIETYYSPDNGDTIVRYDFRHIDIDNNMGTLIFDCTNLVEQGVLNIRDFLITLNMVNMDDFDKVEFLNAAFATHYDSVTGDIYFGQIPEPAWCSLIAAAVALLAVSRRRKN